MSYADELFVKMCRDILDNGTDTKGEKVRPKWEDTNESAYTIKRFGVVNRYDLRKEFPALTLRKTALKSCMDEILWIYIVHHFLYDKSLFYCCLQCNKYLLDIFSAVCQSFL